MSDLRKEFEKWIKSETGFDTVKTRYPMTPPEAQQYMNHSTNLAWLAWQAALKAKEQNHE